MSKMKTYFALLYTLCIFLSILAHETGEVVQYTSDSFSSEIPKNNHFVMFYAPWCSHCQRLSPIWAQLAEMLNTDNESKVIIAKVDCTTDKEVCAENQVTGYPTLRFFKLGENSSVKFHGTRDMPTLTNFINEQLGNVPEPDDIDPTIPKITNGLAELTEDSFEKFVATGNHFVKFYAPWCGHCQKLAPTWVELAELHDGSRIVSISKIDCTMYHSICSQFEVRGYPTLLWIQDGRKVEKYAGQRDLDSLRAYVLTMSNEIDGLAIDDDEGKNKSDEQLPTGVKTFTVDDFDMEVKRGLVFVKFFAPWCGHCKRLAPTWDDLGRRLSTNNEVTIAKVDCSLQFNRKLCSDENVEGFPSLFLFKDGVKIAEYEGSRTLDDLSEFVEKHITKSHDEL